MCFSCFHVAARDDLEIIGDLLLIRNGLSVLLENSVGSGVDLYLVFIAKVGFLPRITACLYGAIGSALGPSLGSASLVVVPEGLVGAVTVPSYLKLRNKCLSEAINYHLL